MKQIQRDRSSIVVIRSLLFVSTQQQSPYPPRPNQHDIDFTARYMHHIACLRHIPLVQNSVPVGTTLALYALAAPMHHCRSYSHDDYWHNVHLGVQPWNMPVSACVPATMDSCPHVPSTYATGRTGITRHSYCRICLRDDVRLEASCRQGN